LHAVAIDLGPIVGGSVENITNSVKSVHVCIGADADLLTSVSVRKGKINLLPLPLRAGLIPLPNLAISIDASKQVFGTI
jgi:hypothetical protein